MDSLWDIPSIRCSVANKAYEELQKPEMKDKYKLVLVEAKKRVLKGIEKENKARRQSEWSTDIDVSIYATQDFKIHLSRINRF